MKETLNKKERRGKKMKKFKVTKKVMALALCGIMLVMNLMPVSAYSAEPRYIVDKLTGIRYATLYFTGESKVFSITMNTPKDSIGRNKYTTTCTAGANVYNYTKQKNESYVYTQTVFSGQTSDLLIKKAYGYSKINFVTFEAFANGKDNKIADTFYIN